MSRYSIALFAVIVASLTFAAATPEKLSQNLKECPCTDPSLCQPILEKPAWEVFGFTVPPHPQYQHYNWSLLTSVARMWAGPSFDPQLVCAAHAGGTRVVMVAHDVERGMSNATAWVDEQISEMQQHFMDGINFDHEVPMTRGSEEAARYMQLVQLTATRLHELGEHYQVSVDVPWSPYDIDGRNYEWTGLAAHVDLLFVMAYDTQSQMWGRCAASANSPPALVERGLRQWMDLGIPASKLVLGTPWYGYLYRCQRDAAGRVPPPDVDACLLPLVPFQGAPCSDAAGFEWDYSMFTALMRKGVNSTPVMWEPSLRSQRFNFLGDPVALLAALKEDGATAGSAPTVHKTRPHHHPMAGAATAAAVAAVAHSSRLDGMHSETQGPADGSAAEVETHRLSDPLLGRAVRKAIQSGRSRLGDRVAARRASHMMEVEGPSNVGIHGESTKDESDAVYQVWFDTPDSLREKYALARSLGLRGVGFWHLEALRYGSTDPHLVAEAAAMWDAVAEFSPQAAK